MAIMGPTGSGSPTLSYRAGGPAGYRDVTECKLSLYKRPKILVALGRRKTGPAKGLFLDMQLSGGNSGVTTMTFLRPALNSQRPQRG